jgi:hypothetical protein
LAQEIFMSRTPFTVSAALTGIAIAYRNAEFIADLVLPEVTVLTQEYKYLEYPADEPFNVPDTLVGRRGKVPQGELGGVEKTGGCNDFGFEIPVPVRDIDAALKLKVPNPLDRATAKATQFVDIGHEQRTAAKVFARTTYPAANRTVLSGTSQFSHASCDALSLALSALDVPLVRPNSLVFGQGAWTAFRKNPTIVAATNRNSGDSGAASKQAVAELLEVKNIYVGAARYNTAKPGQTASLSRLWGNHMAMLFIDPMADPMGGLTFGWTAKYGQTVAGTYTDSSIGAYGAEVARTVKCLDERVVASSCGYFFEDAAA